jgi:hypothetical protein
MKATDDEVRQALRRGTGLPRRDRGACPSSDVLAAAAASRAYAGDPAVLDHLAQCADCALEYRLASSLQPWAAGAAASLSPPATTRPATGPERLLPLALAASLLLCVGLIGWVMTLRQAGHRLETRVADTERLRQADDDEAVRQAARDRAPRIPPGSAGGLDRPHANIPLVDLFPADATRGAGGDLPAVDPTRSPFVVFILNVRQPDEGARYAVELQDESGRRVWEAEGIAAGREALTLAIPSALLSGDHYRIRLSRMRGGVETYPFRVGR